MYPEQKKTLGDPPGTPVATPITITVCGVVQPNPATISVATNGGANINATYDCTLIFDSTPGCPFANCSNNQLVLKTGNNNEPLASNATSGTYTFTVSPSQKPGQMCPPRTGQDSVIIEP
jgi:hypothetical protein